MNENKHSQSYLVVKRKILEGFDRKAPYEELINIITTAQAENSLSPLESIELQGYVQGYIDGQIKCLMEQLFRVIREQAEHDEGAPDYPSDYPRKPPRDKGIS